jgi:Family of unknown function (DUF6010)
MQIHLGDVVSPVVVATLFIIATSAFKEPQRRHFNAIMIAGAGAAYLNGGWASGSLRSRRSSPIAPTRGSTHTASSASAGSCIRAGTSYTTCMGTPLCLSSPTPPWDVPSVTPLSRRGVLLVRLPSTAWQPSRSVRNKEAGGLTLPPRCESSRLYSPLERGLCPHGTSVIAYPASVSKPSLL